MPHFVIDCSENVLQMKPADEILRAVHGVAEKSGLFDPQNIKVRIRSFREFTVADHNADFVHVFGNIMEGRTVDQKANLSRAMVSQLKVTLADVSVISMNIREFEKATFCNLDMV